MTDDDKDQLATRSGDELLANTTTLPATGPGLDKIDSPMSFVAGGLLGVYALKRRDLVGLFAAGVGAGLIYRGAEQNGLLDGGWLRRLLNTKNRRLVPFERQMIIDRPPEDVYRFWRNFENLAIFMPRIRDVRPLDEERSRWQLKITDALRLEWVAELIEDRPGELIVWRVSEPSDIYHEGWISFEPLRDGRSTRLTVRFYLLAPGGEIGARLLEWLQELPMQYFSGELERFRTIVESSQIDEVRAPDLAESIDETPDPKSV